MPNIVSQNGITFSCDDSVLFRWRRRTYRYTPSSLAVCCHGGAWLTVEAVDRTFNSQFCLHVAKRRYHFTKEWLFFGPTFYEAILEADQRFAVQRVLENV